MPLNSSYLTWERRINNCRMLMSTPSYGEFAVEIAVKIWIVGRGPVGLSEAHRDTQTLRERLGVEEPYPKGVKSLGQLPKERGVDAQRRTLG